MARSSGSQSGFRVVAPLRAKERRSGRVTTFSDGSWSVTVELGLVDGRFTPIGFDVRGYTGDEERPKSALSARALRQIPFGALVELTKERLREEMEATLRDEERDPVDAAGRHRVNMNVEVAESILGSLQARRPGRPRTPIDELERAAGVYLRAVQLGSTSPTKAVQSALHLSRSTAGRWIQRCRQYGLIPPARMIDEEA